MHFPLSGANPFEMYRDAAGGQPIELAALASYLGSSVHLVAASRALGKHPDLPTGLVDTTGGWKALREYVATLPLLVREVGRCGQCGWK